jgi:hypothetical protein
MFTRRFIGRGSLRILWTRRIACWLAIVAAFGLSTTSRAIAPTPLPAFSVQALDGSTVSTTTWPLKGKSLLIYVRGNCRACAALLGHLNKKDYPELAAHATIIVAGAGVSEVKAWSQLYPDLSAATWYADPLKAAGTALHMQGAPVILGLKDNIVQWALSGEMGQGTQQQSALNTWVRNDGQPATSEMVRKPVGKE